MRAAAPELLSLDALPVLIVDDHELVGTALALGLAAEGFASRRIDPSPDAVLAAACGPTGIVVLDLDLGRDHRGRAVDGVRLVAPLVEAGWRVLILSGTSDHARIGAALAAGAVAWVPKTAPLPGLVAAVQDAAYGLDAMPAVRRAALIGLHHRRAADRADLLAKLGRLTRREREVLIALAQGRRAQTVADQFFVSLATVRTHIRAVLTKLEVGSQLEAVALYRRAGDR